MPPCFKHCRFSVFPEHWVVECTCIYIVFERSFSTLKMSADKSYGGLRWPNTVFVHALANAMQRTHKDYKKTNMASTQQSFYLLDASANCTYFSS